ncbi:MAG: amidohydrolase [Bacteroidales bacterium]|nr:amidohydrolase [Bacteroidales bacterium]
MSQQEIIELRHRLHQYPCLSGQERYAHDLIAEELRKCRPSLLFENIAGYGIVAFWGDVSEPCIAIRADIDALPIQETTPLSYRSQCSGVSHKCGHDGHTAILLRLAQLASAEQVTQLLLIFQPEEETGLGSQKIIDCGVLKRFQIDKIFAIHNLPGYPLGQVVLAKHTFAAASTGVIYRFQGRQTHASTPEKGLNPGLCVADLVQSMQRLNRGPEVSLDEFRQTTLICIRLGEEAFGTSAGDAEVMFTLRAFTNAGMADLLQRCNQMASEAAGHYGLEYSCQLREPFHATENDSVFVCQLHSFLVSQGIDTVFVSQPFRWSEDFANYLMCYSGAMFGVGAGEDLPELHHPDYDFPDQLIESTASLFLGLVRFLQNSSMKK